MTPLRDSVRRWYQARTATTPARLDAWFDDTDSVRISDSRDATASRERELNGLPARLLLHCDMAATVGGLARRSALTESTAAIESILKQLCEDRLMLKDEDHYLSLPVFRNRPPVNDQRLSNAYITAKPSTADPLLRVV